MDSTDSCGPEGPEAQHPQPFFRGDRDVGRVKDVILFAPNEKPEMAAEEEMLLTARRRAGKK